MSSTAPKWPKRYALADCNTFYCSCERLFRPDLRGKPLVVLSNNDGCLISLSTEAKALGLKVGAPMHEAREIIRQHKVAVFSSNYQLYGNLSRRVMATLDEYTPDLEIYSIDEAFLDFSHVPPGDEEAYATQIRARVLRDIGIPVSIGVGRTKVIAKAASRAAKKLGAPALYLEGERLESTLRAMDVGDLWGVGRRSADKLHGRGICTAWDLRQHDNTALIRQLLTVTGERVRDELRGVDCIRQTDLAEKRMITSTRSFGKRVFDRRDLEEAVSTFTGFACEKLRGQGSVAGGLTVYLRAGSSMEGTGITAQVHWDSPTDDTGTVTREAIALVRALYRGGESYSKAGVFLWDIVPAGQAQTSFFAPPPPQASPLMGAMDAINLKWGRGTVKMASCGTKQDWRMLCEHRSGKTQLAWDDLVEVRAERS